MRTKYCGQLSIDHVRHKVTLCGWVDRIRNLGPLIFIDLRDSKGIVQIVFDQELKDIFEKAVQLRLEFCIQVQGIVGIRKNFNNKIATGAIEVKATYLRIINSSEPLPIDIHRINSEEMRLKYRYLDLRRDEIRQRLKIRADTTTIIRNFLNKKGFMEIETPILTRGTPEGARDYIVPSRVHPGKYYALPQSPQLFKQLLMISGVDRYYQIAKCFRDEDLRMDRQPEFTQIDIETSFMSATQLRSVIEKMICKIWRQIKGINLVRFPVISLSEAINRFGTDKPDLRNPLELLDFSDILSKNTIFYNSITNNYLNRVRGLKIPRNTKISKKQIEYYKNNCIKNYSQVQCEWITRSSLEERKIIKNKNSNPQCIISTELIEAILNRLELSEGDLIFVCVGLNKEILNLLAEMRLKIAQDCSLTIEDTWYPVWIVDFPMFIQAESDKLTSEHHPFSSPYPQVTPEELIKNPLTTVANTYDLVINGYEIGSGSVRIHSLKMQQTVFSLLGMSIAEQNNKFGFFLEALKYGTPPHAGIALGLDRIVMLLTGSKNLREVIAFPKTTTASCLMTSTPNYN
ncbi:MAG: aspartate--tRNA ligase [Candidatus Dasytiphilus stammeri]